MLIKNRTEFIKYFDNLLIENGIRDICKRCNDGEFHDLKHSVGCCSNCEYLKEDGCSNQNTSCLIWICDLIKKLNQNIYYYFKLFEFNPKYRMHYRSDADIDFPIEILEFDSLIDWKEKYNSFYWDM